VTSTRRTFVAVVGVTLAGQLGAIAYEVVVANHFGTGLAADALALSLTLVVAVGNEIVTWISTLFIPHYLDARAKEGPATAASFFRGTLLMLVAGAGGLALLLVLGAPSLVALLAPSLVARGSGAGLLRLFGPLLVLLPLSTLLAGALQAHERFVVASMRQLCWYGVALVSVVFLGGRLGPAAVPIGMGLGLILFCAVLWGRIHLTLDLPRGGDPTGRRRSRLLMSLLPLAIASAANYLNVAVERGIAGRLPHGSLAALTYAFRLLNFPVNLFLLSATTMLFPLLTVHAARADLAEFETVLRRALRLALVFTAPFAALSIALAEPTIHVLFERGAFNSESTRVTATALTYYAPGLIGMAGVHVLMRAYQALQEIKRMVWAGIAVIALNILLMPTLTLLIGFRGLPIAVSTSWIALFIVMLLAIRYRLPDLGLATVLTSAWRAVLAGAVTAGCAWALRGLVPGGAIPEVIAGTVIGIGAYCVGLFLLSWDDAWLALAFVAPGLTRRGTQQP